MINIVKKEYTLNNFETIFCSYYKSKLCLVVKTKHKKEMFYFLPQNMKIFSDTNKKTLCFLHKIDSKSCFFFISAFEKYLDSKVKVCKLYLKGLGFKMTLLKESNILELKLGFSHLIYLKIPKEIVKISLFKKSLCVESYNLEFLGNFIFKIRSCKIPDSYKGKGFYYKYEKKSLKAIKKK